MWMNKREAIEVVKLLDLLLEISDTTIIKNNFLTSFQKYSRKKLADGGQYLFGNYRLGGTVSGRPTSSKPNMLNIPSTGSTFSKPIKECFGAESGRMMIGADYTGLEAVVGALISKDENMLKPYTAPSWYEYTVDINGVTHTVLPGTKVDYKGKIMKIEDAYGKIMKKS